MFVNANTTPWFGINRSRFCLICQLATLVIFAWHLLFFNYHKYVSWVSNNVASSNLHYEGNGRNLKRLKKKKKNKK